jgi:hypothetical protein
MFGMFNRDSSSNSLTMNLDRFATAIKRNDFAAVFDIGVGIVVHFRDQLDDETLDNISQSMAMGLSIISIPYLGKEDEFFERYDANTLVAVLASLVVHRFPKFIKTTGTRAVFIGESYDFMLIYWQAVSIRKADGKSEAVQASRRLLEIVYNDLEDDSLLKQNFKRLIET